VTLVQLEGLKIRAEKRQKFSCLGLNNSLLENFITLYTNIIPDKKSHKKASSSDRLPKFA